MSSCDDDVIELGPDGTFDIPSPPKKDGRNVNISDRLDKVEVKVKFTYSHFLFFLLLSEEKSVE